LDARFPDDVTGNCEIRKKSMLDCINYSRITVVAEMSVKNYSNSG